ncbi:MAG: tetratricopeptide repeat protein [Anaerolineae bacterium]
MDDKLRMAMVAARAGQNKEAQFLLTQVLQDNPQETNAWFLLSHLVDSDDKKITYLEKVVALDPGHEKAAEQLAALTAVAQPTPTDEPETVIAPPAWEPEPSPLDTMPEEPEETMDWLEELTGEEAEEAPEVNESDTALAETLIADSLTPAKSPDLAPAPEPGPKPAKTAVTTATVVPPARPEPDTDDDTAKQLQRLNITLAILVVLLIVVFFFLFNVLF